MKNLLDQVHFYMFGIFTGFVLSGILFLIVRKTGLLRWMYTHETLAGALIAATAAGATIFYLHLQIRQTEKLELDRRNARLDAEKALLTHSLSKIFTHSQDAFRQGLRAAQGEDIELKFLQISDRQFEALKSCIEYASDHQRLTEKAKLITLLTELQIVEARFSAVSDEYTPLDELLTERQADDHLTQSHSLDAMNIYDLLKSSATCFFLAEELFNWSREGREKGMNQPLSLDPREGRLANLFVNPYHHNPASYWPKLYKKLTDHFPT